MSLNQNFYEGNAAAGGVLCFSSLSLIKTLLLIMLPSCISYFLQLYKEYPYPYIHTSVFNCLWFLSMLREYIFNAVLLRD